MLSALRRFFFPVSIVGLVAVLFVVYRVSGPVTAIKGTYALIGLVLAAALYLLTSIDGDGPSREALASTEADQYWVIVLPLAVLAIIAAVTVDRLIALIAFVPLCYALIGYQWLARVPAPRLLPQLVATFLIGPASKYLTTGFYFGATDLLGHVRAGQNLQRTGELTSIISAYPTYEHFPGLHISIVGTSSFTGLEIYDSLLLLGLVAYSVFIVLVYLLFAKVSSKDVAMSATVLFSAITQVSYYSNYFFPQAFATVLLIGLIYFALNIGLSVSVRRTRLVVFSTLLGIGVIFSHHMTVILFSLILTLYFVGYTAVRLFQREAPVVEDTPQPFVLLFTGICALSYWTLYTAGFLRYFSSFVYELIFVQSPLVSDSGGVRAVVGLGLAVPQHTPQVALRSLAAVDGIYYIVLTAIAVLGLVAILYKPAKHSGYAGYLFVGFASVPFLLRTPIINISRRLSLPMSAFFALFGGVGLLFIANRISSRTSRRLLIATIVVLGTTSPLVAADDQYAFHAGPNLYEAYSSPEEQVEFSDQEYAELRAMSDRIRFEDSEVTTLWVTRLAIEHFGGEAEGRARVTDCGITSPSPFVYRTEWKDHQVGFEGNTVGTAVISPTWLDTQVDQANKVYTTGKTGILWSESEIVLGDRSETNRITC